MRRGALPVIFLALAGLRAEAQTWVETARCTSGLSRGEFGSAVAVGEDGLIAVGDFRNDAVYLFRLASGVCRPLEPVRGDSGEWFGFDLAMEGGRLLVGAPKSGGTGVAYLYDVGPNGAANRRQIRATGTGPGDEVGSSVAISGTTLAIGARGADDRRGRAYVGTESALTAVPTPSGLAPRAELGQSVALSGTTLVLGAPSPYRGSGSPGAVYVVEPGQDPVALPIPQGLEAEAAFGYAVAVEEGTILVGAPLADAHGADAGAVFRYEGTDLKARLAGRHAGDQLGVAVSLDSETSLSLVGARYAVSRAGAAYLWGPDGSVRGLLGSQPPGAQLGFSVALRGDIAVVGAFQEGSTGAAYVLERQEDTEPPCPVPAGLSVTLSGSPDEQVAGLSTSEAGTSVRLDIRLTCPPTEDVTVFLSTSAVTEGAVAPTRLTFTPESFSSAQTIEVAGQDDPDCDGTRVYRLNLRATSADSSYNGLTLSIPATSFDDELACLSADQTVCVDGEGTVVYTITLSNDGLQAPPAPAHLEDQLPDEVSVVTASADVGTATADPIVNTVEWNGPVPPGEVVTITIVAGLDPVPLGTEVRNRADITWVRDTRGTLQTVSSNEVVFEAGDVSLCPD